MVFWMPGELLSFGCVPATEGKGMVQAQQVNDLSNITVLLVGAASIARFGPLLGRRGITCYEAQDAATALGNLYRCQPDAIVCDQEMANVNGVEFARIVRHAPNVPDPTVPVVLFLRDADRDTVESARDAGVGQILVQTAGEGVL